MQNYAVDYLLLAFGSRGEATSIYFMVLRVYLPVLDFIEQTDEGLLVGLVVGQESVLPVVEFGPEGDFRLFLVPGA
jgi:hypothetical protein